MFKKLVAVLAVAGLAVSLASFAAEGKDKEITIKGNGMCAKCELKQSDSCQNVVQVEKDGKKVTYYVVQNDVAKAFHKNVCKSTEKVTAVGTVKEVDGKMQFTASKIDLDKK